MIHREEFPRLNKIVGLLEKSNPVQSKKINAYLETCDTLFFTRAEKFYAKWENLLQHIGKDWEFTVNCYNKMNADMVFERIQFMKSGDYSNKSFADVQKRIYDEPGIMEYHMHGLVVAQFMWWDQYQRFSFFADNLKKYPVTNYLEIGAGHGLYISAAAEILGTDTKISAIDISQTSIEMTECVLNNPGINCVCDDVFNLDPADKFDFITIGEVIEHLEDPLSMMKKLHGILKDDGVIYITTPANAPMIDHIYLFNNAEEIRALLDESGFEIIEAIHVYAENMKPEKAMKYKVPLMFAAFIRKKTFRV